MGGATVDPAGEADLAEEVQANARILLVDDDERNLLAMSQVIGDIAEVVTAASGRDALRHLLQGEFAVILLDVYMPGMDGYEVAQLIRQRKQSARIPIIFLSAVNKETEHLLRGYAMGAVDYVFKPVDALVLSSKVSVFVELFKMRKRIEAKSRAEQALREAGFKAQLDRLRIESELSASRARQASILAALPLALFEAVADETGQLFREFVAGDLSRLAGVDAPDIESGKIRWEERIHPDDALALRAAAPDPLKGVLSTEYKWIGRDESHRHFMERCVPLARGDDGTTRWAGTLIDVTERKKLEAQLVQAGKMEALGQLTGGIAHDFNNVLAAILGGVNLLERTSDLDQRSHRLIEQMRFAADKGVDLVRRMMTFARKQELTPVILTPAELCESVSGLIEQTLGSSFALQCECSGGELAFFADRSQLELAVVNLIINARDAMTDGGRISLNVFRPAWETVQALALSEGDYLCVEVRDEGSGIPAGLLERITEPFFTTKAIGKGTGLGLSMVMGFVQQSGGKLDISSELGRGTSVRIFLPGREFAPADENRGKAASQVKPVRQHILVVDDDTGVRTVVAEQLRSLGASVTEAHDGAEAIRLLASTDLAVDMILSDFAMPSMNGLETLEQARKLRPDLRSALMTGYADEALHAAAEATPILRKPVPLEDLANLLGVEPMRSAS